jgi:hypothetical protein
MPRKKFNTPPKHPILLEVEGTGEERTLKLSVPIPASTYAFSENLAKGKKIKPIHIWVQDALDKALTEYEKAGIQYLEKIEGELKEARKKNKKEE